MSYNELLALLSRSRAVHERYLFEAGGEPIRDDVAEICMAIDNVLSAEARVPSATGEMDRSELERSAA
jgi:hypothetical protein